MERRTTKKIFSVYLEYLKIMRPNTYKSYRFLYPKVASFFDLKTKITLNDILEFRKWMMNQKSRLGKPYSESTINRHLDFCRAAFNRSKIVPNPFMDYGRCKEEPRTRYLTEDELERLFIALATSDHPHLPIIVLTAIFTGLRKRAVLSLHDCCIDFGNRLINVREKGGKLMTVNLPLVLIPTFENLLKQNPSGYLFENKVTGDKWAYIEKPWRKVKQKAGLKDFRFHDLRHTFATYTLLVSGNLRLVQSLLGHADFKTTAKYAHILTKQKEIVVEQVVDKISSKGADAILRKALKSKDEKTSPINRCSL